MATKTVQTTDLQGLIPEELMNELIKDVTEGSVMLRLANVKQMNSPVQNYPIMLTGPGAYVVGEGQKITTDKMTAATIELLAKKLAVNVIMSREALSDGVLNLLEEAKEQIAEAFAKKLDKCTLFDSTDFYGVGKSILEKAKTSGNKVIATGQVFEDASMAMGIVEAMDLEPNAFVAPRSLKAKIRNDKTAALNYVVEDKVNGVPAQMHGEPIVYAKGFDRTKADLICGDFNFVYVGILDSIEYKILTEATIGEVNLAEQDMCAIQATMRVGFLVVKEDAFAYVEPKTV